MAEDVYGSESKPVSLDPFATLVGGDFGVSRFISFQLEIARAATIDYQRTKFERMGVDSTAIDEITGLNAATQCRYIWANRRMVLSGWNGSAWAEVADGKDPIVNEFSGRSNDTWKAIDGKPDPVISGLPTLPQTVSLSGMVGQFGRGELFAPQARWDDPVITAGNTFADFMSPSSNNFAKVGSITIRIIGVAPDIFNVGIVPEGGFVANDGNYPVVQAPLTISVGGITIEHKGKKWKGFAVAKRPGSPSDLGSLVPPDPGSMWILCARVNNKDIFPPSAP